mgnify:FL=1
MKAVKGKFPDLFVPSDDFVKMSYKAVHDKMDDHVPTLFQRILFALVHKMGIQVICNHLYLLKNMKL